MTTPPGWYADPGYTGPDPALERWWDGSTWTDYTREPRGVSVSQIPPEQPHFGPPQPPGPPLPPSPATYGYQPQADESASRGKVLATSGVVVLLATALVGGIIALNGDGDGSDQAGAQPTAGPQQPTPGDQGGGNGGAGGGVGPSPSEAPDTSPDKINGIRLPVLEGWQKGRSSSGGAGATIGPYPCPEDPETTCVRGGVSSRTAVGYDARTAEGVAKQDISRNAQDSYGKDPVTGKDMYGGVKSRRQVKSQAVTVAGQKGYLVRWKVDTKKGDDGYVQSLVFPSPSDRKSLVLVRFGFDASEEAPPLTDMDNITQGIEPLRPEDGSGSAA
ncbi:DUF2510 domain-containing protein [Streptomyces sp. NPDC004647]|uniref:DUF2510 domain-containing protein n=1 Tax=Streptomyces sp. NPDC004647 TaxID=3154671 RepID=UPI0033BD5405